MALVLARKPRRRTTTTRRSSSPEQSVELAFPRNLHVVNRTQFEVNRIPAVCISPCLAVVIMARYPNIQVAISLRRGEDREEDRNSTPVREEVPLGVVCPGVLAKGVVPLHIIGEREFITMGGELTQPGLRCGGGTSRAEQATRRRAWIACAAVSLPYVPISSPVRRISPAQLSSDASCKRERSDQGYGDNARTHLR